MRAAVLCALSCMAAGAPQAASDAPPPIAFVSLPLAAEAVASGESWQVVPVRDPQIVATRLPPPGVVQRGGVRSEDGGAGQGTMLLVLGAMLAWIAVRRG
jgi:hypothetical protein